MAVTPYQPGYPVGGVGYIPYGATPPGPRTGTPNTKGTGASLQRFSKTLNPWGFNVPKGKISQGSIMGSSVRKPIPDPQIWGMDYPKWAPKNDPLYWPVVLNWDGSYTRQPSVSGITPAIITWWNQTVEHAYTRDKYQTTP
jgi:hypothetical protein